VIAWFEFPVVRPGRSHSSAPASGQSDSKVPSRFDSGSGIGLRRSVKEFLELLASLI